MAKLIPVDPFDIVIFGGAGDLSLRKLLPALYHRDRDGQISDCSRIFAVSRRHVEREDFQARVREALQRYLKEGEFSEDMWERFSRRLDYVTVDLSDTSQYAALKDKLDAPEKTRIYYLAVSQHLFGSVAAGVHEQGLITEQSRIVVEKPVGHDGPSARAVNDEIGRYFEERQTFRIDHYLGKETVQNLLALRFGNSLFEPLWRCEHVEHVQITVAENIGVGTRGEFYDSTGALRDMVQNHMLQLLCLVAMEPPASLADDDVRNEKLKVLRSLRPLDAQSVRAKTVRARYTAGAVDGEAVPGYLSEIAPGTESTTETFVAIKAEIDNWRWANTPFYLRTGKRLGGKLSEIAIQFHPVPHSVFDQSHRPLQANRLTIRLQPDEGVNLSTMVKEPGPGGFELRPVSLDLSFEQAFSVRYPDAYERLLMEVMRGNQALFMRRDEVQAAWAWIDGIHAGWAEANPPVEEYPAGTWGPAASDMMLDRDGARWGRAR